MRASGFMADEYVWLDGQPVAVRRSAFNSTYVRLPQTTTDCTRLGEYSTQGCGWRYLVNDVSGRTVLAVDDAQRVAGVYEYQSYGALNRLNKWGESAHPYAASGTWAVVTATQPTRGLTIATRLRFGVLDVEPTLDSVKVSDSTPTVRWTASAYHSSTLVTPYLTTTDGQLTAAVQASSCNGPPDAGGGCAGWSYSGATVESFDYLRWASGAQPWELRLRQPGQYIDSETDLFENWNRYFDPATGKYLSPEPLLQKPNYLRTMAMRGLSVPTYAYANNNPVRNIDPDGLAWCARNLEECRRNAEDLLDQECKCISLGGTWSLVDDVRGDREVVGGKCDIAKNQNSGCPATGWSSNTPSHRPTIEALRGLHSCRK